MSDTPVNTVVGLVVISSLAPAVSLTQQGLSLELWLTSITQEAMATPRGDELRIMIRG